MSSTRGLKVGAFELGGRLGRGGMGEVWRARHGATGVDAAIKVITADFARDPRFQDGFHREVRAMAQLEHPAIVRVLDYGEIDEQAAAASRDTSHGELIAGSPFVALELADLGALSSVVHEVAHWHELRSILLALLDALAHSHARGLIHRDLKPDNVLVFGAGADFGDNERRYKLTDFGIAHSLSNEAGESEDKITGTPHYMAPEQFMGTWRSLGPSTDLYALGCLAYQLASGRVPFDAGNALQVGLLHVSTQPEPVTPRFATAPGFAHWVATLMAKAPHERFHKAADAAWALVRLGEPLRLASSPRPAESPAEAPHDAEPEGTAPTLATPPIDFAIGPTLGVTASQLDSGVLRTMANAPPDGSPARTVPGSDSRLDALAPVPKTWHTQARSPRPAQSLAAMSPRLYGLRAIPLVGRREGRDELWRALREVHRERRTRLVILEGPSGCGKSRLARWLCERADELGAAEVMQAVHAADAGPEGGLQGMLTRWFRCRGLSGADLRSRIDEKLGTPTDDRVWMHDELGRLLGADSERLGTDKRESFPALAALFEQVARRRALVVWLDDLQWGEEAVQFLEFLSSQGIDAMPVVFVATVQLEAVAERPLLAERLDTLIESADGRRLQVDALSVRENRELIGELLHLDASLVARIERRVDGNPLFAVQLVGDWVERGWLIAGTHGFRLAEGVTPEIPDDLHEVWAGRIGRLLDERADDDRTALELAAVLGRSVDLAEWQAVCVHDGITASRALVGELVDQRLARLEEHGWSFIHGMLCESLVRMMRNGGRWQTRNATVAAALEGRRNANGAGDLDGRIGRHLFHAGAYHASLAPLLDGARHLFERSDSIAALELLDIRDRAVAKLGHQPTDERSRLEGLLLRSDLFNNLCRYDQARALAEEVQRDAEKAALDDLFAEALLLKCRTEHLIGRTIGADEFAREALAIFEKLGDTEGIMRARLRLGDHGSYVGDNRSAIAHYQVGLEHAEALGDATSAGWSHWGIGYAYQHLMQFDAARWHLERSYQINLEAGKIVASASVESSLADNDRWQGDFESAEMHYLATWNTYSQRGLPCPVGALNLAVCYIQSGRFDQATAWIERSEAQATAARARIWALLYCLRLILSARAADWGGVDRYLDLIDDCLAHNGHIELDMPILLEHASAEVLEHSVDDAIEARARRAFELARAIWVKLRLDDQVERVDHIVDALD